MKSKKGINIEGVKMLNKAQQQSITGGFNNQEECEALSRPGVLECTWTANRCRCRIVIQF